MRGASKRWLWCAEWREHGDMLVPSATINIIWELMCGSSLWKIAGNMMTWLHQILRIMSFGLCLVSPSVVKQWRKHYGMGAQNVSYIIVVSAKQTWTSELFLYSYNWPPPREAIFFVHPCSFKAVSEDRRMQDDMSASSLKIYWKTTWRSLYGWLRIWVSKNERNIMEWLLRM